MRLSQARSRVKEIRQVPVVSAINYCSAREIEISFIVLYNLAAVPEVML